MAKQKEDDQNYLDDPKFWDEVEEEIAVWVKEHPELVKRRKRNGDKKRARRKDED